MISGPVAALAAVPQAGDLPASANGRGSSAQAHRLIGESQAEALETAVRRIRLLDDKYGADSLYKRAGDSLRAAYELLDAGTAHRQSITDRLHNGAGELAISVGWLAHDSDRFGDARSHYAEALATARVAADPALEAHAFCNTAFLARDAGRPREAVRAAQAGQQAAKHLGSARLLSLLNLREAGGWAGLGDRTACQEALSRAHTLFERGPSDADPAWMSFFGQAELVGLEAQCWSALHDWERAAAQARRAVSLQDAHFVRNRALFTAELAGDLAAMRRPEEAAAAGSQALDLLGPVQSSRVRTMLNTTARRLRPYTDGAGVGDFLARQRRMVPRPRTA
jgi:tetratricopeptide (TPR) repeat protein